MGMPLTQLLLLALHHLSASHMDSETCVRLISRAPDACGFTDSGADKSSLAGCKESCVRNPASCVWVSEGG